MLESRRAGSCSFASHQDRYEMSNIDPADATTFSHRLVELPSGRRYHTVDQLPTSGAKDAPVVLMCHGFPDLWYGWRYREWISSVAAVFSNSCK